MLQTPAKQRSEPPSAGGGTTAPPRSAEAAASRGLDYFNLFVANVQTGFGPFIAVYLSGQSWTQTAIGVALSVGTVTSMASQVPAGALVDAISNKTRVAAFSVLVFTASALMFAIYPIPLFVYLAEVLHGISSCTLGPAIAAMSLALAGPFRMAVRLGRNARYSAVGNGVGAALMGAGGVMAYGCSIGQGLTGLSTLALASFVAVAGILAGTAAGLRGALRVQPLAAA